MPSSSSDKASAEIFAFAAALLVLVGSIGFLWWLEQQPISEDKGDDSQYFACLKTKDAQKKAAYDAEENASWARYENARYAIFGNASLMDMNETEYHSRWDNASWEAKRNLTTMEDWIDGSHWGPELTMPGECGR